MMSLSRRDLMMSGAAALMLRSVPSRASPLPEPTRRFIDSVGVNVHIGSESYSADFERFHTLLAASGIRHLRDELRPGNDLDRWRALNDRSGIMFNILVSPATNTIAEMMTYLAALGVERVSAIEGQNEGDSDWFLSLPLAKPDWSAVVVAYQREVHRALRSRYTSNVLPLLSPSVINWKPADVALLRPAAAYSDAVAIHSYVQRAQQPETPDDYAAVSWYLRNMRDAFKLGAPVMVTEVGYCNLPKPGGAGVSEAAAAIYMPRLLLNNFRLGILRTFLYEFLDGGTDPGEWEQHWGLVRNDGSPKPAYHAVRRLLSALKDARPADTSTNGMRVALKSTSPELYHVAFQDDAGRQISAIWRGVRCWDVEKAVDVVVDPQTISVTIAGTASSVSINIPNDGEDWQTLPVIDGTVALALTGKVVLMRVTA